MRSFLLYTITSVISLHCMAQVNISNGTFWVNSGTIMVTVHDLDLSNNGTFLSGSSKLIFTGNANNNITGNVPAAFYELEIAKAANNKIILFRNITVQKRVAFTSGLIDLNQFNLDLSTTAYLDNESSSSRIIGPAGGEVIITANLNAPASVNAGNLGAVISSGANLGDVVIKRGHKTPSGTGLVAGINRYYDISPINNAGLNATLRYNYFDPELNNQLENSLLMFRSTDNGVSWTNENFTSRDVNLNYVEKTGVNSFSKWSLSSQAAVGAPDLTSSQLLSTTQITAGGVIDECIVVRNVGLGITTAPIVFNITNYSLLSGLTVSMNNAPNVTIGVDNYVLDNSNWVFDPVAGTFTSNPGITIAPGSSRNVGIRITRGAGLQAGANGTVTQTTTIAAGTGGGDSYLQNNSISNSILKY